MTAKELKEKYFSFFISKGHEIIPNVSLVPETDTSVLFTNAGMHPLIPFLAGKTHPLGKRLVSVQRCLRTDDIDNVGDGFHHTFFEMLGNWSLGDYWKKESLSWSFEFLTKQLGLLPHQIAVTCFAGDEDAPQDSESFEIWRQLGIPPERIYFLPKKDNWWGPIGKTGPCGPDSEIFVDTGKKPCRVDCQPGCPCGKYLEVWNNVFMEYDKQADGSFMSLDQKNVDTGMGVERVMAILAGFGDDDYRTPVFWPLVEEIQKITGTRYDNEKSRATIRIIADHLKAATFLIADGVIPTNKDQGYILRRLLRRGIVKIRSLGLTDSFGESVLSICDKASDIYQNEYFVSIEKDHLREVILNEAQKFSRTLERGLKLVSKIDQFDGKIAFDLFQSYGFPYEITQEMAAQKGQTLSRFDFEKEFTKHQTISREGVEKKFVGGLVDHSDTVTKLHTATHLLHQALRQILGDHVHQVGSNITSARLRFDFIHPDKLTEEQIKTVEELVNQKILEDLPVSVQSMSLVEAQKLGAHAFFNDKYQDLVKVYTIGNFSKEVCGGPHVSSTGSIGSVNIFKEEAIGSGKRRIYATWKSKTS